MVDPMGEYLAILRQDLRGRIPSDFMESILGEADAHLRDLASELGSQEAAVKKFGGARRYARRILREFTPTPNPWRACVFPFSVMALGEIFFVLAPVKLIENLALSAWVIPPLTLLTLGVAGTAWLGLFRSRQLLLKPIAAFTAFHVLFFALLMAARVNPVSVDGFYMRGTFRDDNVAQATRGIEGELHRWQTERDTLRKGIDVFASAKSSADVKPFLQRGQFIVNPQTITASLDIDDEAHSVAGVLASSVFATESRSYGGYDSTFEQAATSWKIYGPAALERVEREVVRLERARVAIPTAISRTYLERAWMLLPTSLLFSLRTAVIVLKLNVSAWLVWLVVRRFRLPRRRYA